MAGNKVMEFLIDIGVDALYQKGGPSVAEFALADGIYVFLLQETIEGILNSGSSPIIADPLAKQAVDQLLLQPLTVTALESLFSMLFKKGGKQFGTLFMKNLPVFAISGGVQYIIDAIAPAASMYGINYQKKQ